MLTTQIGQGVSVYSLGGVAVVPPWHLRAASELTSESC